MSPGADGRIMLPDGMSYRILLLPQIDRIRPELLLKIRDLVLAGATVVGPKPTSSPSLQDGYPDADAQVQSLANEIWGDLDGVMRTKHYYGKGLVVWGMPISQVVALTNVKKDAEFAGSLDLNVNWIHRRTEGADIYFVVNHTDSDQEIQARFRVAGKEAELWHADTGTMEPSEYSIVGDRTIVPLHMAARESVFVVFRKPAASLTRVIPRPVTQTLATVDGPWDISFPPNFGAPDKIQLPNLQSWTASADQGVKYFSGTATYTKTLTAPQSWFTPGAKLVLDLGTVDDLADVSVNGTPIETLWKPPFKTDITAALKPGDNQLEIKVTNEWNNRIMGDRALPADKKILTPGPAAFGSRGGGGAGTPADSGLLGPVTVLAVSPQ
jgi:hypothetical protein